MKKLLTATEPATVFTFGLLAALKALSLVLIAEGIARGIVGVTGGVESATDGWQFGLLVGTVGGVLRAAVVWATQSYSTIAALHGKQRIRREVSERLLRGGLPRTGSVAVVATLGLDELDNFYRLALPAVITSATVPLLIGARILAADWVSALIIVLTVPLVPMFMVLVGNHTRERADAASASLERLSDHLVELARGLPVLVGLGRVREQTEALRRISTENRATTMMTLRSAFLSSLVLELIATLSVAIVAVFVGVRLVDGNLTLAVGLVALILAPECFAPFRELGAAFHASQDGLAALRRARQLIDEPTPGSAINGASAEMGASIAVSGLTVQHSGRSVAAVERLSFSVPRGSVTVFTGASGSGKSTVLGVLAGTIQPTAGSVAGYTSAGIAWVPQHPHTARDTVRDELRLYADNEQVVEQLLHRLRLDAVADANPATISPGELRRLAVARGLARVAAGATVLILDEPTAHLDAAHSRIVEAELTALRGRVTIFVASHEAGIVALADREVTIGASGGARPSDSGADLYGVVHSGLSAGEHGQDGSAPARSRVALGRTFAGTLSFLAAARWRMLAAMVVGTGASLFAIALTAVSGWLIVRASEQPPIMVLLVAIVGVRFFGLGRATLRYSERLLTHDAVLGSITELRQRLWASFAVRGVADRAIATGAEALGYLVGTADRVRDLVPRVVLPPAVAAGTSIAALIAVALLYAPALPILLAAILLGLIIAPITALLADRHAARQVGDVRRAALARFTAIVAASDDLRVNRVSDRVLDELTLLESRAASLTRASAVALGLGNAIAVIAGVGAAMAMLAVTAPAVASGSIPAALVAVLVLIPIGLIEPLSAAVDSMQQAPALAAAIARIDGMTRLASSTHSPGTTQNRRIALDGPVRSLTFSELEVTWPGANSAAFGPLSTEAMRGEWIVATGSSGSGKSTMLATLLGYLSASAGSWSLNGIDATELDAEQLRSRIAWCPQEAHLFDSSIRGNLLLARGRGDRPDDDELLEVMHRVGLGTLLATLPAGLDAQVGPSGNLLSGGERQRLAVARTLLTRAEIVLLDEPTAHLDQQSARDLMIDLRSALRDRLVVLVSHHNEETRPGDHVLSFDRASVSPTRRAQQHATEVPPEILHGILTG